jgi:hypothetical protein
LPGATRARRRITNPHAVTFLHGVLERAPLRPGHYASGQAYVATPKSYAKSDAIALKEAQDIRAQFLYKNLVKLTPLLEAKGDTQFANVQELGQFDLESLEGDFRVEFHDGSSFRLHNAVVFVTNQFDTHFCRFPTTFHDVVMPGGAPMPSPSEERMHMVFAPATATAPSAPSRRR